MWSASKNSRYLDSSLHRDNPPQRLRSLTGCPYPDPYLDSHEQGDGSGGCDLLCGETEGRVLLNWRGCTVITFPRGTHLHNVFKDLRNEKEGARFKDKEGFEVTYASQNISAGVYDLIEGHNSDTKAIHGLVSDGMRYKFDAVEQTWHWELRGVSRMIYDDVIGSEPIEFEGMQWQIRLQKGCDGNQLWASVFPLSATTNNNEVHWTCLLINPHEAKAPFARGEYAKEMPMWKEESPQPAATTQNGCVIASIASLPNDCLHLCCKACRATPNKDMNKTKSFLTTLGETAKAITIALAGVYLGERMFMASDRPVWRKRG